MTCAHPTSSQRQILQRLGTDNWRSFASLNIPVGSGLLRRLEINGWIERRIEGRTLELRLTFEGLEALRAKIEWTEDKHFNAASQNVERRVHERSLRTVGSRRRS